METVLPKRYAKLSPILKTYIIVNFAGIALTLVCSVWLIIVGLKEIESSDSSYAGLSLLFGVPILVTTLLSIGTTLLFLKLRNLGTLIASVISFLVNISPIVYFVVNFLIWYRV